MQRPFAPRSLPASSLLRPRPTPADVVRRVSQVPDRTVRARYPPLPRRVPSGSVPFFVGQLLASDSSTSWPHELVSRGLLEGSLALWLTRLQAWGFIWFVTSPDAHAATHLRSFHETNTFQFVSSAKLCLAHLRPRRDMGFASRNLHYTTKPATGGVLAACGLCDLCGLLFKILFSFQDAGNRFPA